mmetsp:Transcript_82003/g.232251  ORF Transcript_82003/g.232251 Transcript_82003/m.232251 type:complete len:212 (+) Transcript_82003:151-786(+)
MLVRIFVSAVQPVSALARDRRERRKGLVARAHRFPCRRVVQAPLHLVVHLGLDGGRGGPLHSRLALRVVIVHAVHAQITVHEPRGVTQKHEVVVAGKLLLGPGVRRQAEQRVVPISNQTFLVQGAAHQQFIQQGIGGAALHLGLPAEIAHGSGRVQPLERAGETVNVVRRRTRKVGTRHVRFRDSQVRVCWEGDGGHVACVALVPRQAVRY